MSRLPPLDLLVPFEASARLGSFTKAATEMNVTQSAVSQRVRTLEEYLGTPLFERKHRAIALTPQGRELLNGASVALQHLRAATDSVRGLQLTPRVRLATDTSIAALWLMPRLTGFQNANPGIAVDLTVSDDEARCLDADLAVLHGTGDWPGFDSRKLFDDAIFPVCAPGYLDGRRLARPEDLLAADLLDLDYLRWNWMNWGIWLTEAGLDPAPARRVLRSNSYPALIEAARAGQGVALGWAHFLDGDLRAGRLVRPMPEEVATSFGYFAAIADPAPDEARRLAEWFVDQPGLA